MAENEDPVRLRAAINELQTINRVIDKVCRVREINHILSVIIDELVSFTGATQGVVNLVSSSKDRELVTVVRNESRSESDLPYRVSNLITGRVLLEKRVMKIDDLDKSDLFPELTSEGGKYQSVMCCPMLARGEVIGLTTLVRNREKGPFADDHARLAGIISSQAAQVLANALLVEELARNNDLLKASQQSLRDENIRLRHEVDQRFGFENIIGDSPAMRKALALASRAAEVDAPVLVTGPTGVGKELIARGIHFASRRKDKPFVVKNCGVKTESLLESELFGHVKGAFTGALRDRPGLFKEAHGGTIFLDEIGDAPASTQAAILRVLENGEIRPIGGTRTEYVDVRVISATNKTLLKEIDAGAFRQDLYYRLNTFTIEMQPLSERPEDIPPLVHHYLRKLRSSLNNENLVLTPGALDLLTRYEWPGNVRQLQHELQRAAVVCDSVGVIDVQHLSPEMRTSTTRPRVHRGSLKTAVESLEQDLIAETLEETGYNIMQAARKLGLTRKGLKDKLARYGMSVPKSDSGNRYDTDSDD